MVEDDGRRARTWTIVHVTTLNTVHLHQVIAVGWAALDRTVIGNFARYPCPNNNVRWMTLMGGKSGFGNVQEDACRAMYGIAGRSGKTASRPKAVRNKPGGS